MCFEEFVINWIKNLFTRNRTITAYRYSDKLSLVRKSFQYAERTRKENFWHIPRTSKRIEDLLQRYSYQKETKDYWKSPREFENDKGGDCEDFALYYLWARGGGDLIVGKLSNGEYHAIAHDKAAKVVYDCRYAYTIPDKRYRGLKPIYKIEYSFSEGENGTTKVMQAAYEVI